VYPGAGANWHDSKAGPCNVTPCLYDGKLYSIGSTGRVYCLDAGSGREIWQHHIGPRHLAIAHAKRTALAEKSYGRLKFNRDFGGAPTVIGGVLVMPDFTSGSVCGLLALDPATGRQLWRLRAAAAEDAVPLCFVQDGKEYILSGVPVISADSGQICCIEPATGKILWKITNGIGRNATTMCLWNNYLLAHAPSTGTPPTDKGEPATVACYRIALDGFEKVWTLPLELGIWKDHPLAASDGFVYVRLAGPELLCVDIRSGKIVARTDYNTGAGATMTLGDGHLIVDRDGSHVGTSFSFFKVDPLGGRLEALTRDFSPPHWHGTSYHPPHSFPYVDGRLFVRGGDGVYCYDLRRRPRKR
jgi:outer membrane protein assembly factor BamB